MGLIVPEQIDYLIPNGVLCIIILFNLETPCVDIVDFWWWFISSAQNRVDFFFYGLRGHEASYWWVPVVLRHFFTQSLLTFSSIFLKQTDSCLSLGGKDHFENLNQDSMAIFVSGQRSWHAPISVKYLLFGSFSNVVHFFCGMKLCIWWSINIDWTFLDLVMAIGSACLLTTFGNT